MNWRLGLHIILGLTLTINFACKKEVFEHVPEVYGHAGTALSTERAVYPPNSEKSILYGLNVLGAVGVEVDVQMTRDSVLVLFHDEQIDVNGLTCVGELTWNEIQTFNETENHPIIRLSTLINLVQDMSKKVMLDLKHYNFCTQEFLNPTSLNWALDNELSELSAEAKARFIINCRNIDLLVAVNDEFLLKSFETENIQLGIDYVDLYDIDLILTKLRIMTPDFARMLETLNINYGLFGVKTKKEIKETAAYRPNLIISDNIAGTKAYYN